MLYFGLVFILLVISLEYSMILLIFTFLLSDNVCSPYGSYTQYIPNSSFLNSNVIREIFQFIYFGLAKEWINSLLW